MKTYVVTGGAGFIGSLLVDQLSSIGANAIRVIDDLSRGKMENLKGSRNRVTFFRGDVTDMTLLINAMSGADVVYHLAAQASVIWAETHLDQTFRSNVIGTFSVLRAAREAGVKRVVFASSREVYGEPQSLPVSEEAALCPKNAYGMSKLVGEMYCKAFTDERMDVSVLRFTNVYGPRDEDRVVPRFIKQALLNQNLVVYGGSQTLDFVSIDTVVAALIKSADVSFQGPINIGSGQRTTLLELAATILSLTGSRSQLQVLPLRNAEVTHFVADTCRMKAALGLENPSQALDQLPGLVARSKQELENLIGCPTVCEHFTSTSVEAGGG